MQFNALSVVKIVASSVVGLGAGKVVASVIKNNIKPETLIDKVTMVAASWAIGGMFAQASKQYTSDAIDDTAETVTRVVNKVKLLRKLDRINHGLSTFEGEGLDPTDFVKNSSDEWVQVTNKGVDDPDKPADN